MIQQALPLDDIRAKPTMNGQTTNRHADGVFGWYRYIQDFTGDFAVDWLERIAQPGDYVWEPFCGSGTTLVAAQSLGLASIGYDISPFMVDVARTKVNWSLDPKDLEAARIGVLERIENLDSEPSEPVQVTWDEYESEVTGITEAYPDDKKLWKWIAPNVVVRVAQLLEAIDRIENMQHRRFMRLAAASILIPASNMDFRPNISYQKRPNLDFPVVSAFAERATQMIRDYRLVSGSASDVETRVEVGDARTDGPETADLVFTSPPYPNDMEYVHQTRLELALLNYVDNAKGLTVLKKQMISSSVKLVYKQNEWQKQRGLEIDAVRQVFEPIAKTLEGRNWGWNAADMTAQYFGGMSAVLANWNTRLKSGGTAAVVIGDSAFNGVKVPSDELLVEVALAEGLQLEAIEVFRRRWNTKHDIELRESVVVLRKP